MLLDCWPSPGFKDFKERWTMPAFVQGFRQSHDLHRQIYEELLSGKNVLTWESFSRELTLVLALILLQELAHPKVTM